MCFCCFEVDDDCGIICKLYWFVSRVSKVVIFLGVVFWIFLLWKFVMDGLLVDGNC